MNSSHLSLLPESRTRLDGYWARFFGCSPEELRPLEPRVQPHAPALADYAGAYLQSFGAAPLLSLPAPLLERYGSPFAERVQAGIEADLHWEELLGPRLSRVIGPAWLGYADARTLRPAEESGARPLLAEDGPALERLRQAVAPLEWEHGGRALSSDLALFGAFWGSELGALAGYERWGEEIAHLFVLAHPAARGRGLARAALSVAARRALEEGLLPQYRTLASNLPSRRLADSLGFAPYATSLALRLLPGDVATG